MVECLLPAVVTIKPLNEDVHVWWDPDNHTRRKTYNVAPSDSEADGDDGAKDGSDGAITSDEEAPQFVIPLESIELDCQLSLLCVTFCFYLCMCSLQVDVSSVV